jgi:hypothetical protein
LKLDQLVLGVIEEPNPRQRRPVIEGLHANSDLSAGKVAEVLQRRLQLAVILATGKTLFSKHRPEDAEVRGLQGIQRSELQGHRNFEDRWVLEIGEVTLNRHVWPPGFSGNSTRNALASQ